jgi:hypothetical protein
MLVKCCGSGTIYSGSGSGSDFGKVSVSESGEQFLNKNIST